MNRLPAIILILLCGLPAGSSSPAAQESPLVNFVDTAEKAGLRQPVVFGGASTKKFIIETTGTGVAIFDYDNDGWPDILIVNGTTLEGFPPGKAPHSYLYHNNRDGTFSDVSARAGLKETGWGQGVCVGDYDNDGGKDFFVTYYGKNRLYHNRGDGRFEEIAAPAGVAGDGKAWGTGCAFVDYDRDGRLDLAVAQYVDFDVATAPVAGQTANCIWKGVPVMCGPRGLKPGRNLLYHNVGKGRFEDVTRTSGFEKTNGHYCFSVSPFDYNDDGWPDVYVACDSTPSILYENQRDGTFRDVAVTAGAAYNEDGREQAGMGTAVGDYNGDGRFDVFRTNFSDDTSTLYRNNGDRSFSDVTFAAGFGRNTQYLGWGVAFLDFDNDSWPDLLLVNGHVYPEVDKFRLGSAYKEPRLLYHNRGDGTFVDVSRSAGPGIGAATSARGLAVGDLWNDGRVSAVISNMNDPPSLLVNQVKNGNHWIGIETVGTRSNRDGIGARVTLRAGQRALVDEVRSGSSYDSNHDMRLHFGLGQVQQIDTLEVRWPSGLEENFDNVRIDAINKLVEGKGKPVRAASQPTSWPS